jgi:hypothetical protein
LELGAFLSRLFEAQFLSVGALRERGDHTRKTDQTGHKTGKTTLVLERRWR